MSVGSNINGSLINVFNGLTLLEEKVASASASLVFTASFTTAYDEYIFEFLNLVPATDATAFWMRMSTDGGATYDSGSNYKYRMLRIASATAIEESNSATKIALSSAVIDSTVTTHGISGRLTVPNPLSTSLKKIVYGHFFMLQDGAGTPPYEQSIAGGGYESTTAVNAVQFLMSSGNITSGTIRCYGVTKTIGTALSTNALPYLNYQDQKAQNTHGGTFTSGAWRTRDLNTEVTDTHSYGTLGSNQITLAAGTYRIKATAPAFGVNQHQTRLQNVTDGTTVLTGTSEYSNSTAGSGSPSRSIVEGQFTIGASKALELQHQCNATHATDGFGTASNFTTEVYTIIELWRVG